MTDLEKNKVRESWRTTLLTALHALWAYRTRLLNRASTKGSKVRSSDKKFFRKQLDTIFSLAHSFDVPVHQLKAQWLKLKLYHKKGGDSRERSNRT